MNFPGYSLPVWLHCNSRRAGLDLKKSEKLTNTGVLLAETFFKDIDSESNGGLNLNQASLVERKKADSELNHAEIRQAAMSEVEIGDVPEGFFISKTTC